MQPEHKTHFVFRVAENPILAIVPPKGDLANESSPARFRYFTRSVGRNS